ncbi:hypothetical protein SERLADRAFT_458257 [Serpula lacrymans var. lacrymans S7.9]|uniref:Uncharacterized protein n=1 Tax=Serpula lacrymans var. lacrymans (strain S7.9) TaxID=578457 RepID=F8NH47_SERL9|nr:uncharacterized protein SERLADRAFT_458257 [Serpula lacrymans var. lacrymans S7.9]EGO29904.1 hypothetical protein SERLADRAFT_458257 [Serpula lacrymans var. lacrymans S7.9]
MECKPRSDQRTNVFMTQTPIHTQRISPDESRRPGLLCASLHLEHRQSNNEFLPDSITGMRIPINHMSSKLHCYILPGSGIGAKDTRPVRIGIHASSFLGSHLTGGTRSTTCRA